MSRIMKLAVAVAVLALIAGGALWWFVIRNDAPPPAALPNRSAQTTAAGSTGAGIASSSTTTADAGAVDGEWSVVTGTGVWVGYRVEETVGPNAVHGTAVGRTPGVEGSLSIADSKVTAVDITADLTRLTSDEDRRDKRLHTGALATDTFPEATFSLTEPIELGALPALGEKLPVKAKGELTIHGVTKTVELDLDTRWNGDSIDVAGKTVIRFDDYGIDNPSFAGMLSVEDRGILELQLTFERS